MNDIIVRKHVATPLDVAGNLRVGVNELCVDVLRVLEGGDGNQVGD